MAGAAEAVLAVDEPLTPRQQATFSEIVLPEAVRRKIRERRPRVVTVVPDGALHRLPLEALLLDEASSRYALDDETIPPFAYAPSAMVQAILQARPRESSDVRLLTVGIRSYEHRPELVFAGQESEYWSEQFARLGPRPVQLPGAAATRAAVCANAGDKTILHFAVHGDVSTRFDSADAAALALAPDLRVERDTGLLNLQDVYALPLEGCELAVLSACRSNLGPERTMEAGSTLTRAFLSAGARRVVASLWSVGDESTELLMEEFAGGLARAFERGETPDYAQALQQARRRVRANPKFSDPRHWAPFVLIGPATGQR